MWVSAACWGRFGGAFSWVARLEVKVNCAKDAAEQVSAAAPEGSKLAGVPSGFPSPQGPPDLFPVACPKAV